MYCVQRERWFYLFFWGKKKKKGEGKMDMVETGVPE